MQDLGPLVHSLLGQSLAPIRVAGRWKGARARGIWNGVIQLDEFVVGGLAMQGEAQIEAASNRVTISPRRLVVSEPNLAGEPIELTDGAVGVSRARITLESLVAKAGTLGGRIDGYWNPEARPANSPARGRPRYPSSLPSPPGHTGCSVKSPREGRKEAQANVTAQAQTPLGSWHAVADMRASGADWLMSQWQIQAPAVSWSRGERQVEVTDATAKIDLHWPQIQVTSLSLPQAQQVSTDARLDLHTRQWSAQLAVDQLHWPSLGAGGVDVRVQAEGDSNEARVSELRVTQRRDGRHGQGRSVARRGRTATRASLGRVAGASSALHAPGGGAAHGRPCGPEPSTGRWQLEADVTGQVQPLSLDAQATLAGQNITLGRRLVDRVQVPVHLTADARQVDATTQPFELLGGQWQLTGQYDITRRTTQVHVLATDLSPAAVASMAGLPLASRGRAHGEIRLQMPGFEIQKAVAMGTWSAEDVNIPPLAAQRAQGTIRIGGGTARLDDIQLEQDGGRARRASVFRWTSRRSCPSSWMRNAGPRNCQDRPVTLVLDGRTKLRMDVVKKTAEGDARLRARSCGKTEMWPTSGWRSWCTGRLWSAGIPRADSGAARRMAPPGFP